MISRYRPKESNKQLALILLIDRCLTDLNRKSLAPSFRSLRRPSILSPFRPCSKDIVVRKSRRVFPLSLQLAMMTLGTGQAECSYFCSLPSLKPPFRK